MKKIIAFLIALSMTISVTCTTAFAIGNTTVTGQNDFVYTDKILQTFSETDNSNANIALNAADDEIDYYSLGYVQAKNNPLVSVSDHVNNTDNILSCYSVDVCTRDHYDYEVVDELVVLLTGLSYGDRLVMIITNGNDQEIASGVIDGRNGAGAYISFPVNNVNTYKFYISLADLENSTNDNTDVSYTLQVASRYVYATQQFYADTTSIEYSGYQDWSSPGYMYIRESDVPSSAIVDSILTFGTLINTKTGKKGYVNTLILNNNGTKEIAGSCPDKIENIDRYKIPLAGTWKITYQPHLNRDNPHVLNDFLAEINFTYDILVG